MNKTLFRKLIFVVALGFGLSLIACSDETATAVHDARSEAPDSFQWNIPSHIPLPTVNPANPMSEEKFALGRHLFYDQRLSGNGSMSCSRLFPMARRLRSAQLGSSTLEILNPLLTLPITRL
jgi:cytochrome c peroxidase